MTSRNIDIITDGRFSILLRLQSSSSLYERIVFYLSVHLSVMPEFFLFYLLEIICKDMSLSLQGLAFGFSGHVPTVDLLNEMVILY